MAAPKAENCYKLLLVGDSSVGKSSLVKRYTSDSFEAGINSTVGVDFTVKYLDIDGESIKLKIWDTAGSERFRSLTKGYYRDSVGVLLVYDITKRQTFEGLRFWIDEVKENNSVPWAVTVIIGNKLDLETRREVQQDEAKTFAENQGCFYDETSAKSDMGVEKAFERVVDEIRERLANGAPPVQDCQTLPTQSKQGSVTTRPPKARSGNCCLIC